MPKRKPAGRVLVISLSLIYIVEEHLKFLVATGKGVNYEIYILKENRKKLVFGNTKLGKPRRLILSCFKDKISTYLVSQKRKSHNENFLPHHPLQKRDTRNFPAPHKHCHRRELCFGSVKWQKVWFCYLQVKEVSGKVQWSFSKLKANLVGENSEKISTFKAKPVTW